MESVCVGLVGSRHTLKVFLEDEEAYYSKRDDGQTNDVWTTRGAILLCVNCPAVFFRPHQQNLTTVEVDLVEPIAKRMLRECA